MANYYEPVPSPFSALAKAALVGAYAGTACELAAIFAIDFPGGAPLTEAWAIPILVLAYGTFAIPFTALGLCLFGLPLGKALRPLLRYRWSFAFAVVCGALSGQVFLWLFIGLRWGRLSVTDFPDAVIGAAWGLPTGLAYWYFERRARGITSN